MHKRPQEPRRTTDDHRHRTGNLTGSDFDLHRQWSRQPEFMTPDEVRAMALKIAPPLRTQEPRPCNPRTEVITVDCPKCGNISRRARRRCRATGGPCGGTGKVDKRVPIRKPQEENDGEA